MSLSNMVATPLAWALVHSLWQGAVVCAALLVVLGIARSSRVRYAAACSAMAVVLAAFAGTVFYVSRSAPLAVQILDVRQPAPPAILAAAKEIKAQFDPTELLPWLAPIWLVGVLLFYARAAFSWTAAQRLRTRGACRASDAWQQRVRFLAARMGVTGTVTMIESCFCAAPAVIGHLKPVILVPLGFLSDMPVEQVELILLHELAHIRRFDYLTNLLQTVAEGIFFYHPAVWWISGIVRAERESCCDDRVVAATGDARSYANALAVLEQDRRAMWEMAQAANGGNLMKRIRRLLYPLERPRVFSSPLVIAAVVALGAACLSPAWQTSSHTPYTKWLQEDVAYILQQSEREAFLALTTDRDRERFIEQFWLRRDPTPGTPANEMKEEHYRRIAYANGRFGGSEDGWKTDRGRTYILYGPADELESHPSGGAYRKPAAEGGGQASTFPFEAWSYRDAGGRGPVTIEFVDRAGNGNYVMASGPAAKYRP